MEPGDFHDEILIAEEPVEVISGNPAGPVARNVEPGREVGRIFSHQISGGSIYWILYADGAKDELVKHDRFKLDIRQGGVDAGNLLATFAETVGFGSVAESGKSILKYAALGLSAYAVIKVAGIFK